MKRTLSLSLVPLLVWFVACGSDSVEPSGDAAGGSANNGGSPAGGTGGVVGEAGDSGTPAEAGQSNLGGAGGESTSGSGGEAGEGGSRAALQYAEHGFFPATVDEDDAEAAYDAWKAAQVESCGANGYRVKAGDETETLSEGIGQGALLAVAWDDQALFDGLWTYYQKAAAISDEKKGTSSGLMGWRAYGTDACTFDELDPTTTSHADLDMAMALLNAECTWGGGEYLGGAEAIISALKEDVTTEIDGKAMILTWDDSSGECFKPSYPAPGYYRVFARAMPDDEAYWETVADDSYDFLNAASNATTGLAPEWAATGSDPCADATDYVGYDAMRTPWRVATDYAWFGTAAAKTWLNQLSGWFDTEVGVAQLADVQSGFLDDGSEVVGAEGAGNSAFVGGFAVATIAEDQPTSDAYHQVLVDVPESNDPSYYELTGRALLLTFSANKLAMGCF